MLARLAWFGGLLLLVSAAGARDIYVDNLAGDDRCEGRGPRAVGSVVGPVATISKALRLAQAGDRIALANTGEPYRESISLVGSKHSGSPIGPFVMEGNGATLDGTINVPANAWTHHLGDVFYCRPARLGYQQLFLGGRPAVRHPTTASAVSLPALEPLEWCLYDGKIFFRVEAGQLPSDYEPACCGYQTGITLYYVRGVVVRNLTVQGFHIDGASASDEVGWVKFERVMCRGNGRSGISVAGSSWAEVDECALGNNGDSQLRCEGFSQTRVYRSRLVANTAAAIAWRGGRLTIDGKQITAAAP